MDQDRRNRWWPKDVRLCDDDIVTKCRSFRHDKSAWRKRHRLAPYAFSRTGKTFREFEHLDRLIDDADDATTSTEVPSSRDSDYSLYTPTYRLECTPEFRDSTRINAYDRTHRESAPSIESRSPNSPVSARTRQRPWNRSWSFVGRKSKNQHKRGNYDASWAHGTDGKSTQKGDRKGRDSTASMRHPLE